MAQVLKEEIEKKILDYATEDFFQKDYRAANMREIAQKAGIPTGLIYSYFKNKEDLFDAVVSPAYNHINMLLKEEEEIDNSRHPFENFFAREMEFMLTLLKTNRRQFIILIDKSKGTNYENALEDIVSFMRMHIKNHLSGKINLVNAGMDDTFLHIIANSFVESFCEVARHYEGEEWARNMLVLLGKHYFYGINAFG